MGMSVASGKGEILEAVLWFLPDWVQMAVLGLIVLAVVASWVLKIRRRIVRRRAVRGGQPVNAAAQYGQGSGADHLGQYAPQRTQAPAQPQPSGADFLGSYAPEARRDGAV
ncbi:hypothetical protein ACIQAC_20075 [Streptomyces sp. NPDC088387]|uniref:hypothetical protein n=1 Tax=Streptomyces sp. NPDC088387 TaxID=3365859 RepID=UPI0037F99F6A